MNGENAGEHDRKADRPEVSAKQRLENEENVEVERAVIIRRVVAVETVLHHLVDKPPVDALVEMRRLDAEEEEPEKRAQADDHPRRPIDMGGPTEQLVEPVPDRRRN